jgi:ABC-type sugar transport system substrate-binding protein
VKEEDTVPKERALWKQTRLMTVAVVLLAGLIGIGGSVAGASVVNQTAPPMNPTKSLCHGKTWKIGYDVFSATQPFANLVTQGLKDAAKLIGCATVVTTVDNLNGPVAIGNIKTLLNQGANAIVDFNVLAAFQPAIAKQLKNAHIPGVAVVGADLPGYPSVGANNYGAAVLDGRALALAGRKKFGSTLPYVVVGAEPTAGPIIMQRYHGAVAGAKTVYRNLPTSHIIMVVSDGTEAGTYNNAVSAFSRIPSGGVVLTTAVNDEVSHAMYKAAQARKLTFLVNSFGGDPFGLGQVCRDRTHYAGALYLEPKKWGASALVVVLREANGMSYPKGIGIKGVEVTATNPIAGCK